MRGKGVVSLSADEKWHIIPATATAPYGITVRCKDGSYRTPTAQEFEDLLTCQKRAVELASGLADALGILRFFVTIAEPAMPEEASIARDKMKALAEILQRSGYLT